MGGAKTLSIIVAANIKGLETAMKKANKSVSNFGSTAARVGSMMTFGITAPLVAMGKAAVDTFVEFENSMAKVQAVTQSTKTDFALLNAEAKRLGGTTQFTAQEFANLQLILGRKGFKTDAITNMTESVAKLALATGSDLNLAAKTVSSSINAFNLQASDASHVANTLAMAASNSSLQLSTFSTAFANAGASASAAGVDIEELSAMMGVLLDNGIKASKVGTGLNGIFIRLKERGISLTDSLDRLSQGELTLERATALVGKQFGKQFLILAKNRDKVKELTHEYETNTDALDKMAEIMGGTTFAKIKKMQSAMELARLEFGEVMAKMLMPMIELLTNLANKFSALSDRTQIVVGVLGSLAALAGPVLLFLGGMSMLLPVVATGLGIVGGALSAISGVLLPILGVIAGVGALLIVIQNLFDNRVVNSQIFTNFFDDLEIMFLKFGKWLLENNPMDFLVSGINKVLAYFGKDPLINQSTEKIKGYADEIARLEKLQASRTPAKYVGIIESAGNVFENLKKVANSAMGAVSDFFSFDQVGAGVGEDTKKKGFIKSPFDFSEEYEKYLQDLQKAKAATQRWTNAINTFAQNSAITFAQSFADIITSGQGLLKGLGDVFTQILKQLAAMVIKAAVLAAIFSLFPGMQGMGAAGAKSFTDIFQGMLGGKFADGGRPPLNKLSLVGENGPELFNPGNQSGTIIPNHAMGGSVIPDVRISGNDLLIVFDRANRRQNRR
tara:strand:+ start:606 stop:2795 length:2190 start_codon:yes stop_codon:yes gene_type:complete